MAVYDIEITVAVGTVLDGDVLERFVDNNGCPTERRLLGGQEVVVRYDDLPDTDRAVVNGIPCTSALRTVIDIATSVDEAHLECILIDALRRGLFTIDEAKERVAQPDMTSRAGAVLVRALLEHWERPERRGRVRGRSGR